MCLEVSASDTNSITYLHKNVKNKKLKKLLLKIMVLVYNKFANDKK